MVTHCCSEQVVLCQNTDNQVKNNKENMEQCEQALRLADKHQDIFLMAAAHHTRGGLLDLSQ